MLKNEIFKKFLANAELQEFVDLDKNKLMNLDLSGFNENKLLEVIKNTILFTDNPEDIDSTARRINQYFKNQQL